jgi:hypothetical protein
LSTESGLSSDEATEVDDDDDDDDVDNLTAAMMADADEQDVTILPDAFTPSEPVAYSPDSYVPVGRMDPKLLASPALHSTMPYVWHSLWHRIKPNTTPLPPSHSWLQCDLDDIALVFCIGNSIGCGDWLVDETRLTTQALRERGYEEEFYKLFPELRPAAAVSSAKVAFSAQRAKDVANLLDFESTATRPRTKVLTVRDKRDRRFNKFISFSDLV